MSFEVRILGSGAALPTGRRNPSAQYVNCNERHILIDCGEGTQTQLRKFGVKIQKIRYIFISHLHGDHYFGLMGLLSTMNLLGRTKGITLFAPPELKEIIDLQLKASGHHYDFNVDFVALDFDEKTKIYEDKLIELFAFPLKHRIKTHGLLIQEKKKEHSILGEEFKNANLSLQAIPFFKRGEDYLDENGQKFLAQDFTIAPKKAKSYAYCSDTAYLEDLKVFISKCTCLYHEATFINVHQQRAKSTLHSTAEEAGKIAKVIKAEKLLLGHISSRYESTELHLKEAKAIFPNTIVVEDGDNYYI